MDGFLKQSTAVTIKLGPFLDSGDGDTEEGGLTISQADVRLSKNGGNFAQKNDATACAYDETGFYDCALDATDTGTLGILTVACHESGALLVKQTYLVIPANEYDSFISGTDALEVNVTEVEGADPTNTIRDSILSDATPFAGANIANLDAAISTRSTFDHTAHNVTVGALVAAALADFFTVDSGETYAGSAVTGSVVREIADNAGGSALTEAGIADAVLRELVGDHNGVAGSLAEHLTNILGDTAELQTDWVDGGRLDTIVDGILADTGELQTDWVDGGRLDTIIDTISTNVLANAPANMWAAITAVAANTIADHVLRRNYSNARGSGDGDTVAFRSLLGAVAKAVNKVDATTSPMNIYHEDDSTPFGQQTLTTSASADAVVSVDTV